MGLHELVQDAKIATLRFFGQPYWTIPLVHKDDLPSEAVAWSDSSFQLRFVNVDVAYAVQQDAILRSWEQGRRIDFAVVKNLPHAEHLYAEIQVEYFSLPRAI